MPLRFVDHMYQAFEYASPIWQQAIFRLSWAHGLIVVAYGVAAWICFLNVQLKKEALSPHKIWLAAVVLMGFLGSNIVLQGDVFITHFFREIAKLQGWYGHRSEFQYFVVGLVVLAAVAIAFRLIRWFEHHAQPYTIAVCIGLLALTLLFAVRTVSAHGTDAIINTRFAGISIGRIFELMSIALVVVGASCNLRQPGANPKALVSGMGRHV